MRRGVCTNRRSTAMYSAQGDHRSPSGDGRRWVAVVTGASAGVGRATAVAFAEQGFDVGLISRGRAGLDGAAREVEAAGGRSHAVSADVSDYGAVAAAATEIEDQLGEIDVWVNDAMTTVFSFVSDTDPADFKRAIEVTFLGQVWGTMVALERMRPRDCGRIVNVGSALAFVGLPLQAAYCSSKFACRGFFESVRAELIAAGSGVSIGMVHLPAVNTPQFAWCKTNLERHPQPVPPIYEPHVAAEAIVRAALDGRRERVLGSWNKMVALAGRAMPGVANRYAAATGVDSQLEATTVSADRPENLYEPADTESDYGARGDFSDRAGGFFDSSFLVSLPAAMSSLVRAVAANTSEILHTRRPQIEALPRGG